MDALQDSESLWTACPQCRAANPATTGVCTVCGARQSASAHPPVSWRSTLARHRVAVVIAVLALSAFVIAVARSPEPVLSATIHYGYPLGYGLAALRAASAAATMFRARAVSAGITLTALTVLLLLFCLATFGRSSY